jgi:CheY-like chemotaxis protein
VLYIEDNPANLKLIRKIIALRPEFTLLDAMNAELGLEIARRELPDLILLDINLPGMNGIAAIAQLQAWPETANIPVIAVTANAMKRDIDHAKSAGFADYLTKPIDIARLHQILDTLSAREH